MTFLGLCATRERMHDLVRSVSITASGSTRLPGGPDKLLSFVAVDRVIRRSFCSSRSPFVLHLPEDSWSASLSLTSTHSGGAKFRARELRSSSSSWLSFDAKRLRRLRLVRLRLRPASTRQLDLQPPRLSAGIEYVFALALSSSRRRSLTEALSCRCRLRSSPPSRSAKALQRKQSRRRRAVPGGYRPWPLPPLLRGSLRTG